MANTFVSKVFAGVALVAVTGYIIFTGESLRGDRNARVDAASVASKVIPVNLKDVRLHVQYLPGKLGGLQWSVLETKTWAIASGTNYDRGYCFRLLGDFSRANAGQAAWPATSMNAFLKAHAGQTVKVRVAVPRYSSEPVSLNTCPGMSFNKTDGTLVYAGKPVAVWVRDQEGLPAAAERSSKPFKPEHMVLSY